MDTASQSDDPSNNGTFSYMLHKKKESFGMLEVKSAYLSFLNRSGRLLHVKCMDFTGDMRGNSNATAVLGVKFKILNLGRFASCPVVFSHL